MDGLFFYWFFWVGWIIVTFFYPKDYKERLKVAGWILTCILLSNHALYFGIAEVNVTGLFILFSIYAYASHLQTRKLLYFLFTAFIVMLATVSFLLFELFDPVSIIVERKWLLAALLTIITLLLQNDHMKRICTLLFGLLNGEILFAFILSQSTFFYSVAALSLLDALALSLAFLITWNAFELLTASLAKLFHTEEKEKQKLL